jgi:hypothetical protein
MRRVCLRAVHEMEAAFVRLESQVPPPRLVPFGQRGEVFRYLEQSVYQALILKYARVITGLLAVDALLARGLLQEVGCMQRVLDEVAEDIYFLAASLTNGEHTDKHERYLASFWGEQFPNPDNSMARQKKPDAVPRSKIVGYVHETLLGPEIGSSQAADASHNVSSTYSGFVHARAVQIMDLYGGKPQHFHLRGMLRTPRMDDSVHDAWNYFYRGLMAAAVVAKAFGDANLTASLFDSIEQFLADSGARGAEDLAHHLEQKHGRACGG